MSATGHGIFRRCPQWVNDKVIKEPFQCAPVCVASVGGFHDPELCRTIGQRVGDLAKLNGMDNLIMRYSSGSTGDIAIRHRIGIFFRCRCHQVRARRKKPEEPKSKATNQGDRERKVRRRINECAYQNVSSTHEETYVRQVV